MTKLTRILAVTGGLFVTGAVIGAVLGSATLVAFVAIVSRVRLRDLPPLVGVGALFGGSIGAVLGPVIAWTLLRTIPLGRAIGESALGAAVGAFALLYFGPLGAIAGALLGFGIAALRLRLIVAPRLARDRAMVARLED